MDNGEGFGFLMYHVKYNNDRLNIPAKNRDALCLPASVVHTLMNAVSRITKRNVTPKSDSVFKKLK